MLGEQQPQVAAWRRRAGANLSEAREAREKASAHVEQSRATRGAAVRGGLRGEADLRDSLENKVSASQRLVYALERRAGSITSTMDAGMSSVRHLQAAVQAKEAPLQLCLWRLEERAKRPPRERIRDAVENALEAQRLQLEDSQRRLTDAIRHTAEAMDGIERTLHKVQAEVGQTKHALQVDETCLRSAKRVLLEKAPPQPLAAAQAVGGTAGGGAAAAAAPPAGSPPPHGRRSPKFGVSAKAAQKNEDARVDAAARLDVSACSEEKALVALRDRNDKLIRQCDGAMKAAAERTVSAFQAKVEEYSAMRSRLEASVRETQAQIVRAKSEIASATGDIRALKDPMDMVAKFHADRLTRSRKENIQDPVSSQLHAHEMFVLRSHDELRRRRDDDRASLQELEQRSSQLMDDLKDKTTALRIDVSCLTHDFAVYTVPSSKTAAGPPGKSAAAGILAKLERRLVPAGFAAGPAPRPRSACRQVSSGSASRRRGPVDLRPVSAR